MMNQVSINRLEIYRQIGVPEVWRFDETTFYHLLEGEYCPQEASKVVPLLHQGDMIRFLQISQTMGETTWIREFRRWVKAKIEADS